MMSHNIQCIYKIYSVYSIHNIQCIYKKEGVGGCRGMCVCVCWSLSCCIALSEATASQACIEIHR